MIYQFPDLDTLRLAITSSIVPPEISLAAAVGGLDDQGHVWLQPAQELPRKAQTALRKLGVRAVEANGALQAEEVCCWLQMLPVVRDPAPPALSGQLPVLFELPDTGQLSGLVGEMLRLGNDRQSFRWLKDPHPTLPRTGGGKGGGRVLLRVIGPPYYSLLRALDGSRNGPVPRAYLERAPRVWVEIGHTHSLVEQLKPAAGQLLLLRPSRDWVFLDDGPFHDIYDLLDYSLPSGPVSLTETQPAGRLKVPLRLAPGSASEPAQLWVVRDHAYDQIDTLVREADDHLIGRLAFAVSESAAPPTIVLRVRPSKLTTPEVSLAAERFRPYPKIPNLFMPIGQRLKPPLRPGVVRRLLADDPDRIVWLQPEGDGKFVPESLPDAAFRPLQDWVEYVLDREHTAVEAWIGAARFDFAGFICKDDARPEKPPPPEKQAKARERKSLLARTDEDTATAPPAGKAPKQAEPEEQAFQLPEIEPSALQQRLTELEEQFVASDRPLDDPDRLELWPEMAELNTALPDKQADAAVCWLNALWEKETPPADWLWHWARGEAGLGRRHISGPDLERYLGLADPSDADLRALVACLLAAAWSDESAGQEAVADRLPQIQGYLERHEGRLGVRAVWLAWMSLAHLAAGDVLGLARARDRLLERLLQGGLSPERDLPSFLRASGSHAAERFRAVRERVVRLADLAQAWVGRCSCESSVFEGAPPENTQAYTDLIFSFGLARLGETTHARRLLARASQFLGPKDEVHKYLLRAFTYRIEQALSSKKHGGPLPEEFQLELGQKTARDSRQAPGQDAGSFLAYKVDRLREQSRILEPEERINVYQREIGGHGDRLERRLEELATVAEGKELESTVIQLLQSQEKPSETLRVLSAALRIAPRLREAFTAKLLTLLVAFGEKMPPILEWKELEPRAQLFERAVFVAGHYDRRDVIHPLIRMCVQLFEPRKGIAVDHGLDALIHQCFRSLRKLGLKDEIQQLLSALTDFFTRGQHLSELRSAHGVAWPKTLQKLVHLAGALLYFGREKEARPVLDQARELLFDSQQVSEPVFRANLACSYATALGQASINAALDGLAELFGRLVPIADRMITTGTHYSLIQLRVIEAVVLAVSSDDFAVGQNVRRWLDEDEYLVRRRVHRDLRRVLGAEPLCPVR